MEESEKKPYEGDFISNVVLYEKVVLLLSVTVKILYLECCVMKKLLYCFFLCEAVT